MQLLWRPVRVLLGLLLRRPIVGACVIPILPDGTVVLIRRRDSGLWGLPGGFVDWGEDIATAAQRELAEETGLTVARIGRLVGVYSSARRDPRFHSVCVVIEVHVEGVPVAHDPAEVMAVKAVSLDAVSDFVLDHDHARHLQDYLMNKTVLA
ncbi:MAG: NUDIX hydrolase [Leptolyngbya sp. SIO1E4]|nr:NUDIX hydrolase [Leptolyngbya sp. SIO1E4]